MTIDESDKILDIVAEALQDTRHRRHPISALKGHDLDEILLALKLRIANERILLAHRPDFEEKYSEGLKIYGSIPWQIAMSFVPDELVDDIMADGVFNPIDQKTMTLKDERLGNIETESSFGEYCKSLAPDDPQYWKKVFARIDLNPKKPIRDKLRDAYWPIAAWILLIFSLSIVGFWRMVILLSTLVFAIAFVVFLKRRYQRQGKNGTPGWTIIAVVSAIFICGGVANIIESRSTGPEGILLGFVGLYLLRMLWNNDRPQKDPL